MSVPVTWRSAANEKMNERAQKSVLEPRPDRAGGDAYRRVRSADHRGNHGTEGPEGRGPKRPTGRGPATSTGHQGGPRAKKDREARRPGHEGPRNRKNKTERPPKGQAQQAKRPRTKPADGQRTTAQSIARDPA